VAPTVTQSLREIHPRELKGMVREIPTLPAIFQQLFEMLQDPNVSVTQVAEIISKDQSLAAKVLHLVNSAFYGAKDKINTVNRAVVILGFRAVRTAALATSVFDYFEDESSSDEESLTKFWKHSIAVASICKIIASKVSPQQEEEAFVMGLLHDSGKLVMKKYFPEDFEELGNYLRDQQVSWYKGEKQLFKVDHTLIGKALFRAWKFPEAVVEAIHLHHNPGPNDNYPQLTALVHLADYLSYQMDRGAPLSQGPQECSPVAQEQLGITVDDALEWRELFEKEISNATGMLQLNT
jgi:putative nucleotidyltransferase with HDIG domain